MEQRGRLCRPRQARPTSWQTFLKAHWGAIAGADFFTTEVWTWRGLVTYYTVFVIDLASRRVQILGSRPHPEALFMEQIVRTLTMAQDGGVDTPTMLICDRDRKWSADVRRRLEQAGLRVLLTPERALNAKVRFWYVPKGKGIRDQGSRVTNGNVYRRLNRRSRQRDRGAQPLRAAILQRHPGCESTLAASTGHSTDRQV